MNCGIQHRISWPQKIRPAGERHANGVRPHEKRAAGAHQPTSNTKAKPQAQKIKAAADRQAAETIADADADATRIRGEGEAEAAKTLPIFQHNPELANFVLRIDALQQSLNQKIDADF